MTRSDLLKMFVLNEISDEYLKVAEITKRVEDLGSACGMILEPNEIIRALGDLMQTKLARGYLLTPTSKPPKEIGRIPAPADMEKYYFRVTKKGMERQLALDKDWPFDADNVLRKDWHPPDK
jgi:hypothetical protein